MIDSHVGLLHTFNYLPHPPSRERRCRVGCGGGNNYCFLCNPLASDHFNGGELSFHPQTRYCQKWWCTRDVFVILSMFLTVLDISIFLLVVYLLVYNADFVCLC